MATEQHTFDSSLGTLIAGIAGSLVSLRFVQGTLLERVTMAGDHC